LNTALYTNYQQVFDQVMGKDVNSFKQFIIYDMA